MLRGPWKDETAVHDMTTSSQVILLRMREVLSPHSGCSKGFDKPNKNEI